LRAIAHHAPDLNPAFVTLEAHIIYWMGQTREPCSNPFDFMA